MLKLLNVFAITILMFVASCAPYVSAKGAALAFAQNPEERDISSTQVYEEEVHNSDHPNFFIKSTVHDFAFPSYIVLKPQILVVDVLKPPSL